MYALLRPILFQLDAEKAHHLTFNLAQRALSLGLLPQVQTPSSPKTVMGITFPNRVGLAAGLDKNGQYIDILARFGFGFIEIGTITPRAQAGNPTPRLFRLPKANGIINRMGFNNDGVDALLSNVSRSSFVQNGGILGINIGKNADTPIENAVDDYLIGLSKVYAHAHYITVNISSPNTKNLRDLQQQDALNSLLAQLRQSQLQLADAHQKYVPMVLKIAPDMDDEQIATTAELLKLHQIDGVIATNTTLDKSSVAHLPHGDEMGGLSGEPVRAKSTEMIKKLHAHLDNQVPIIGVGGIFSAKDADEKIAAGAQLIQVYSGLIYKGPALVRECV
ncbi:quinone-dependent dihydroorotate dehydrogenase [Hydromonas duriensis]|uniref:Dihydroorotate dehydrogenase (quinone) n=1 Tax=Hydromonas duriensis TaxID=1527608 RepID=A0A4R6Y8E6_9BURK|nr:quinone-dependent dihydroorotate dehydrogenase [Hydromonas duriensis]TDR31641.1 dihydroorotate oxidase A [Hydromonas duriensis]